MFEENCRVHGVRKIWRQLRATAPNMLWMGKSVGRLHIAMLMKRMRLKSLYCRPNTSQPASGHKIYP